MITPSTDQSNSLPNLELKENESRFAELFERMSSAMAIYEPVNDGRDFIFKEINQAAKEIEHISHQKALGRRVTEVFPRIAECGLLDVLRCVSKDGTPRKHPSSKCLDNQLMGCRDTYAYRLSSGEVVVVYQDVTTQTKAEMSLIDSEMRLRAIMESIHAGIVIIDPAEHLIVEANPMALKMIGAEREQVIGQVCHKFICPAEVGECPITDLEQNVDNSERELINNNGESIPILKTVAKVNLQGKDHLLESFLDITQLKALEDKLRKMANIDSLTGTVSRAHFLELCQKEINRALRYGRPLSLIIFDIDHFKKINDAYGHQAGDLMLKELCLICKNKLRDTDFLGRIGGEEFAILSVESDLAGATIAAERLRSEITESAYEYEGNSIRCTVSFGVAQLYSSGDSLSMLFKRADEALYKAKNLGRNRVCQSAM